MKERGNKFSCEFFDTLLLGIWFSIVLLVLLGLVFMVIPSLPKLIAQKMTADLQVGLTVFAILFWSAVRININYELSLWVIPFCYTGWQVVIATLWTTGIMPRPINIFVAPLTFTLITAIFAPTIRFIWNRVKPRYRMSRADKIKKQKREQ